MTCDHDWHTGPFYVMAAGNYEEPTYYPPSSLVRVEHCTKCGLLRLPAEMRSQTGRNLNR